MKSVGASLFIVTVIAGASLAQVLPAKRRVDLVTANDTELVYVVYERGDVKRISPLQITLWPGIPADEHPQRFIYDDPFDFELAFLERGFAQLRNYAGAPEHLRNAQDRAKAAGFGMWRRPAVRRPAPPPPPPPPWWLRFWNWLRGEGPASLIAQFGRALVIVVGFLGAYEVLGVFIRWRRRFRVDVMFFGQMSVGKTWLWLRTIYPNVSDADLAERGRTLAADTHELPQLPMGHYIMRPHFTDLPGSHVGVQLTYLLGRRRLWWLQKRLFPQKRIWVISLAPTADVAVTRDSPPTARLDREHMLQQFGSLALYEGALREPGTNKPALVVICVTKTDLLVDDDAELKPHKTGHKEVVAAFKAQLQRLKDACKDEGVPSAVVLTSARYGWGRVEFAEALRDAFFPVKAES